MEHLLRYLWPRAPYRCKECGRRSWQFVSPLRRRHAKTVAATAVLGVVLYVTALVFIDNEIYQSLFHQVRRTETHREAPTPTRLADAGKEQPPHPSVNASVPAERAFHHNAAKPSVLSDDLFDEIRPRPGPQQPETALPMPRAATASGDQEHTHPCPPPPHRGRRQPLPHRPSPQPPSPQPYPWHRLRPSPLSARRSARQAAPKGRSTAQAPDQAPNQGKATQEGAQVKAHAPQNDGVQRFRGVQSSSQKGGVQVSLLTDGPVKTYKSFFLQDPPRFVIDLDGDWQTRRWSDIKVNNDLVKNIRIGRHPDRLRIVMDLKSDQVPAQGFRLSGGTRGHPSEQVIPDSAPRYGARDCRKRPASSRGASECGGLPDGNRPGWPSCARSISRGRTRFPNAGKYCSGRSRCARPARLHTALHYPGHAVSSPAMDGIWPSGRGTCAPCTPAPSVLPR